MGYTGNDGGKFNMGLDPSEPNFALSGLSNQIQHDRRLSETTIDLIDSSAGAPSASCVSGGARHGEAPFAPGAGEASLPQHQSSLSSYAGTVLPSAGSTELNCIFPTVETDHITPYLEQATDPVLKAVTDAALENDLLELLSSPIALPTSASAVHPPPEKLLAHEVQGETVSTMAEGSIPLLCPEDYPSVAASAKKKSFSTADSRQPLVGKPLVEEPWTARPEFQRELSSRTIAKVEKTSLPLHATAHPELHQTCEGNGQSSIPDFMLQPHGGHTVSPLPELQQLTTFDKNLRERSLAIYSATDEQMKRPMKKSRTYSKAIPSRFCHICTRQSKKSSPHAFCLNINRGTCRKAVCEKCFIKFGWDWKAVSAPGSQWLCPHCCNICPKGAQCYNYVSCIAPSTSLRTWWLFPLQEYLLPKKIVSNRLLLLLFFPLRRSPTIIVPKTTSVLLMVLRLNCHWSYLSTSVRPSLIRMLSSPKEPRATIT